MFSKHARAFSLVWLTFDTAARLATSSSHPLPGCPVQSPSVKGGTVGREGKLVRTSTHPPPTVDELRVQPWTVQQRRRRRKGLNVSVIH